jgi:hypothetical protein
MRYRFVERHILEQDNLYTRDWPDDLDEAFRRWCREKQPELVHDLQILDTKQQEWVKIRARLWEGRDSEDSE